MSVVVSEELVRGSFRYLKQSLFLSGIMLLLVLLNIALVSAATEPKTTAQADVFIKNDGTLWKRSRISLSEYEVVRIGSDSDWTQVTGKDNYFAIKTDGSLWVWGENSTGVLGTGDMASVAAPLRLAGTWNKISYTGGGLEKGMFLLSGLIIRCGAGGITFSVL